MGERTQIPTAQMARRGFVDSRRALTYVEQITSRHLDLEPAWLDDICAAADPDLSLHGIARIDEADPIKAGKILDDPGWRRRVATLLGGSRALNEHCLVHRDDLDLIAQNPRRWSYDAIAADLAKRLIQAEQLPEIIEDSGAADRLRLANKAHLVRIATRDLCSDNPCQIVVEICAELTDLADAIMQCALRIAKGQVPGSENVRIGIVGLGKCGAQELNYISDVDVLYVVEPATERVSSDEAIRIATLVVAAAARICSSYSAAGTIWQVDANLRPDGKAGPLVRTLESHRAYYEKWAKNWEFQAMLKARPMAGDRELAEQFCQMVAPMVWQVGGQPNFITQMQAMRQRVISLIPAAHKDREIKLGPGGLRDVEFSVQLLQLVHGRVDERLRTRSTLDSLTHLAEHGYIGREDAAHLDKAYRFLRVLEHREQLFKLRRTHLMPQRQDDLKRLARHTNMASGDELWSRWQTTTRQVLRLKQRVFYSPLLETVSRLSGDEITLSTQAAIDRLHALGFNDPPAALRHIETLTTGLSRTAEIQRQLMPAMLEWLSDGPNPDLGLLEFRKLSETMGSTSWYMRALRDEGWLAERLARLLSASRYISDLLRRDPSVVQMLADAHRQQLRDRADLDEAMGKVIDRYDGDLDKAYEAIRALRRRELFHIAATDVLGFASLSQIGHALTDLAGATIQAALQIASRQVSEGDDVADDLKIGVIAMGRWGGGEMSYTSDADAVFIVPDDTTPEQMTRAAKIVTQLGAMLAKPGPEPSLTIDTGLRPHGASGPVINTASTYLAYYQRWSEIWEAQALLRASYGAGDRELIDDLLDQLAFRRYSPDGLTSADISQIRRLKGRMETERTNRRTAKVNLKLGPGGLSDVEWTIQLLQLTHAHAYPSLQVCGTVEAVQAASQSGLMSASDAQTLIDAWEMASQLRNSTVLVRGRSGDLLPKDPRETASIAMLRGYEPGHASDLLEQWARTARHATAVVDRIFWGQE